MGECCGTASSWLKMVAGLAVLRYATGVPSQQQHSDHAMWSARGAVFHENCAAGGEMSDLDKIKDIMKLISPLVMLNMLKVKVSF